MSPARTHAAAGGCPRGSALFTLATELPTEILACMLGITVEAVVVWQQAASGGLGCLRRRPQVAGRARITVHGLDTVAGGGFGDYCRGPWLTR
ncbi:hypothetical protein [Nocardia gipuzkoensis]|uniref:hypothetical protein n=1 Tax=Nocardia gipuzkoensis TaxID=2749991 RepID=UPI00237D492C|nr:hypothetical protein [Nocardia gipuzkoensis]MDE1675302.1 hypothetical protein [Nocardia gipuzkoensis]